MSDIVSVALSQVGVTSANGGDDKYIKWYGGLSLNVAWCAIFVSWCANQAGVLSTNIPKYADCDVGKAWFNARKQYEKSKAYGGSYLPKRGDIIFFSDGHTQSDATHTGIVIASTPAAVATIEGNTSDSVRKRNYQINNAYIIGYGRTGLSGTSSASSYSAPNTGSGTASGTATSASASQKSKDIKTVSLKNHIGEAGVYKFTALKDAKDVIQQGCEIMIQNDKIYLPVVEGDITLEYERKGSPGKLQFNVVKDDTINFQEGNPVRLRVNGKNVFYGYIFTKSRNDNRIISVTAYDQLRYLKNKDTLSYSNKKYSDLIIQIAKNYGLKTGSIEDTGYVIGQRIEEGTLFDILQNAADLTLVHTGKMFILYDDFGSLTLKSLPGMLLDVAITDQTAESFSYSSSIDSDTYTRIKLARDNSDTGERETVVADNASAQSNWGVLQFYEKEDTNISAITEKAKLLLSYYGKKQRKLTVSNCFGDIRVRGGSFVYVKLNLGDITTSNYMMVEKVKHTFTGGVNTMDLTLIGIRGEFNA